jgi:hypothetical protein
VNVRTAYAGIGGAVAGAALLVAGFHLGRRSGTTAAGAVPFAPAAFTALPPAVSAPVPERTPVESVPQTVRREPLSPPGPDDLLRIRALLRSGSADVKRLRRELWRLSKTADPEALAILEEAVASALPQHRALAAAVLGATAFPEAPTLLRGLLQDPVPEVVCAAVRALGEVDTGGLRQWGLPALDAGGLPAVVRAELLMTLARHGDEDAIERVMAVTVEASDGDLVSALLDRMMGLPADVAVPVLQAVVAAPQSTADARAQAFDALAEVDAPDAAALLLQYATQRQSVADRRQAAEALGTIPGAALSSGQLCAAVAGETDVQTRVFLYDAMRSLAAPDPVVLLPVLQAEQEPQARTAALLGAGTLVGMGVADAAMESWFETEGVQALEASAGSAALSTEYRLRALGGLRNARTAAARAALARLAQSGDALIRELAARPLPGQQR